MTRAAWGKAKHEIYAIRQDVLSLLAKGENLETIYQHLKAEKKITVGRSTFKRHAAIFRNEAFPSKPVQSPPSSAALECSPYLNSKPDVTPGTAKTGAAKHSSRPGGPIITTSNLPKVDFAAGMREDGQDLLKPARNKKEVTE